jgi:hypothetical protein
MTRKLGETCFKAATFAVSQGVSIGVGFIKKEQEDKPGAFGFKTALN